MTSEIHMTKLVTDALTGAVTFCVINRYHP